MERQITRKWRTRDKSVTRLRIGRWFIKRERWDLSKLKRIFRADTKRQRPTCDSYELFLDDERASSRAWTYEEALKAHSRKVWALEH